ncbi:MAG: chitobiase/beta-hexosaminidase C-terminal domain-containing protein [Patescibacteria group bacterium]
MLKNFFPKTKSCMVKIFFVLSIAVLAFFALSQKTKAANWEITSIDSSNDVGEYSSIAIDTNGKVHISYIDETNRDLKYATNISGLWIYSTLDSASDVLGSSLALDSNNKVHIVYYDWTDGDLKYATNVSSGSGCAISGWSCTTIDSVDDLGLFSAITIDSNNNVHISYYDWNNGRLKYATNISSDGSCVSGWSCLAIDNTGTTAWWSSGWRSSIASDSNNKIHISYYDRTGEDLHYATNTNSGGCIADGWYCRVIDSPGNVGGWSSIALDSNEKVHISYCDDTNYALRYATNSAGSWITSTLDSSGGAWSSLAIDPNNKVHIAYNSLDGLKYNTNAYGSWIPVVIDSVVPQQLSLALDFNNKTHISYYDSTNKDLKYAVRTSPVIPDSTAPTTTAAPSGGSYETNQTVALSASDNEGGSGVDKIYYTTDGSTPTTASSVYSSPINIFQDTALKFFATDLVGNQEQVRTENYIIKNSEIIATRKKTKFVTKSPKENEILIKKKRTYQVYNFKFSFKKFPKKLKKTKYYLQIQKFKKYPKNYSRAKTSTLKKYWKIKTNLAKYSAKNKKQQFKLKLSFKYTKKEFKTLKKKNKAIKEKDLVLRYRKAKPSKWGSLLAKHNQKKNTFSTVFSKFYFPTIYFAIGL